jgi:hypothetical protein
MKRRPVFKTPFLATSKRLPVDLATLPLDRKPLPLDRRTLPLDRRTLPFDRGMLLLDGKPLPLLSKPLLVDRTRASLDSERASPSRGRQHATPATLLLPLGPKCARRTRRTIAWLRAVRAFDEGLFWHRALVAVVAFAAPVVASVASGVGHGAPVDPRLRAARATDLPACDAPFLNAFATDG